MLIFTRLESIFYQFYASLVPIYFYYMELPNFLHFPSPWVARRLV